MTTSPSAGVVDDWLAFISGPGSEHPATKNAVVVAKTLVADLVHLIWRGLVNLVYPVAI